MALHGASVPLLGGIHGPWGWISHIHSFGKHWLSATWHSAGQRASPSGDSGLAAHPGSQTTAQTRDADTRHHLLKRLHQTRWLSLSGDHRGPRGTESLSPRASLSLKYRRLPHHWDPRERTGQGRVLGVLAAVWSAPMQSPTETLLTPQGAPCGPGRRKLRRRRQSRSDLGGPWRD